MKNFSWISVLIIALTASLGALYIDHNFISNRDYSGSSIVEKQKANLSRYSNDSISAFSANINFVATAQKVRNSVVYIRTTGSTSGQDLRQFHQGIPDMDGMFEMPEVPNESSGSGVLVTEDGFIITNNHVIEKATKIQVLLNSKQSFEARVVGRDPSTDLALLKIESKNLPFIKYGDSDKLQIGEWVLAIGNPFDLTSTVTAGIVSGKGRNINILRRKSNIAIESFIQTDAAVNPGNSGGALVDLRGELIGINTAIASPTGSYSGYSFAVPVNLVKKVIDDLLKFGQVQRALLGISIVDVTDELATKLGLKSLDGVYVRGISKESSAQLAGIKEGDVIKKINGQAINTVPELQEIVGRFHPGDKIQVLVDRDEKEIQLTAVLQGETGSLKVGVNKSENHLEIKELGAVFAPIDAGKKGTYRIDYGVEIVELNSPKLKKLGLSSGSIIYKMDKKPVKSPAELKKIYDATTGGILIEAISPEGERNYFVLVK